MLSGGFISIGHNSTNIYERESKFFIPAVISRALAAKPYEKFRSENRKP
jgi:hypothetical protein